MSDNTSYEIISITPIIYVLCIIILCIFLKSAWPLLGMLLMPRVRISNKCPKCGYDDKEEAK
jgi:hypothetical protein